MYIALKHSQVKAAEVNLCPCSSFPNIKPLELLDVILAIVKELKRKLPDWFSKPGRLKAKVVPFPPKRGLAAGGAFPASGLSGDSSLSQ